MMPTNPLKHPMHARQIFCSDLDGTLVGDRAATALFQQHWENLPSTIRPLLVYSSGRLIDDILQLIKEQPLPDPDFILGGVGTQAYDCSSRQHIDALTQQFQGEWNLGVVHDILSAIPEATFQEEEVQHDFKSSWYLDDATPAQLSAIQNQLLGAGIQAQIIYSSQRDLDVLPWNAGKGGALQWLSQYTGVAPQNIIVAGDSGNDLSMFQLPHVRGIAVANAHPELELEVRSAPHRHWKAPLPCAAGVIQGLHHFGIHRTP